MVEILSREVIRITIPSNAFPATASDGKTKFVEVYVATPNGISNKLQVLIQPPAPATAASGKAFVLNEKTTSAAIVASWTKDGAGPTIQTKLFSGLKDDNLKLDWKGPDPKKDGPAPPEKAYVRFLITKDVVKPIAIDFNTVQDKNNVISIDKGTITVAGKAFCDKLLDGLVAQLKATDEIASPTKLEAKVIVWQIANDKVIIANQVDLAETLSVTLTTLNKRSDVLTSK
jgi:hypothetical protein